MLNIKTVCIEGNFIHNFFRNINHKQFSLVIFDDSIKK